MKAILGQSKCILGIYVHALVIFYWFVVTDKVTFKQDREFEVITVDCEGRW